MIDIYIYKNSPLKVEPNGEFFCIYVLLKEVYFFLIPL